MIIHIFTLGNLFLQPGLECYGASGIAGEFIVIGRPKEGGNLPAGVRYLMLGSDGYRVFLDGLGTLDGIVLFHGLLDTNLTVAHDILGRRNRRFKTAWIVYGAEIQNALRSIDGFHEPLTAKAYYSLKPVRRLLPLIKSLPGSEYRKTRAVLEQVDFFVHFIPEELEWVSNVLGVSKPHLWSTYAIIDDYVGKDLASKYVSDAKQVLIGNSSSFTSNHLDMMDRLRGRLPSDASVVVPLSYGNRPYAEYVIKMGKAWLGEQFKPITELMPRQQYNELLLDCPVVVMNHRRQQGLGNIITALWMGARVHLQKEVSTYRYLHRLGFAIFTIEDFFSASDQDGIRISALPRDQADHNRSLLLKTFSRENVARQLRESFQPYA